MLRYDPQCDYESNYAAAPEPPRIPADDLPPVPGTWDYCGIPVASPLAVAAGPLLNGRWVLYYASLGFDVLTYKTVRSVAHASYEMPNLQPVRVPPDWRAGWQPVRTDDAMRGSWAVSFGMPSRPPDVWRADVEATRKALPRGKVLSVSVVATPRQGWALEQLADDFATCARWAVDSGADCVEVNFSCPNVTTSDAQLYLNPADAGAAAARVRSHIGGTPLLVKIGHVQDGNLAREIVRALSPHADALVMVNCIPAAVADTQGRPLFGGERRGIAGEAVRDAVLEQVRSFTNVTREDAPSLKLVGVGGICNPQHVRDFLACGCHAVQLATAPMLDPGVGLRIRRDLADGAAHGDVVPRSPRG
jgi:dihydroorotate dehydrogenase